MNPLPKLRHNIAALGSVQIAGYLFPLITTPYVTRVLGAEAWGTVALVQVVIGYFTLFTNWGFNWSGTRKIAAHRSDLGHVSDIFLATWLAQWLLCGGAILLLSLFIMFVPFFSRYAVFYLWGIGGILSNVLFPVWFLNGMECMKQVATVQIATRAASIPLIFLLVHGPEDAPFMLAIGGASGILGGVLSLFWIKKNLGLTWRWPSRASISAELAEGATIFASTVWIGLYTTLTPTILGLLAGNIAVGHYVLADRARQLAQAALNPISQALFPRLSQLFKTDERQARTLLLCSSKWIVLFAGGASMALWLLAEYIVLLLAGEGFRPAIGVLKWLAPLPFIISLSNIFGVQVMLPTLQTTAFNRILGMAGALSLCIIIPLIIWQGAKGAAMNTLITECFVTIAMAFFLWKTGFFRNPIQVRNDHES